VRRAHGNCGNCSASWSAWRTITGAKAKHHATRKLRIRVERGEFAVLFSGAMDELFEQVEADAWPLMELDVLREAMLRAYRQIERPGRRAVMVSRTARASAKIVRVDAEWRKGRGKG
jgi:hypothetical protein